MQCLLLVPFYLHLGFLSTSAEYLVFLTDYSIQSILLLAFIAI